MTSDRDQSDGPEAARVQPDDDQPVTIRIREDGPLVVTGAFALTDHDGNLIPRPENTRAARRNVALCRCGDSLTKPFCDGTHRGSAEAAGFDGSFGELRPPQT